MCIYSLPNLTSHATLNYDVYFSRQYALSYLIILLLKDVDILFNNRRAKESFQRKNASCQADFSSEKDSQSS